MKEYILQEIRTDGSDNKILVISKENTLLYMKLHGFAIPQLPQGIWLRITTPDYKSFDDFIKTFLNHDTFKFVCKYVRSLDYDELFTELI